MGVVTRRLLASSPHTPYPYTQFTGHCLPRITRASEPVCLVSTKDRPGASIGFGTPDRFVNTAQFGTITAAAAPGRQIQISARLSF